MACVRPPSNSEKIVELLRVWELLPMKVRKELPLVWRGRRVGPTKRSMNRSALALLQVG